MNDKTKRLEILRSNALKHYDEISSRAHSWHPYAVQCIKNYVPPELSSEPIPPEQTEDAARDAAFRLADKAFLFDRLDNSRDKKPLDTFSIIWNAAKEYFTNEKQNDQR